MFDLDCYKTKRFMYTISKRDYERKIAKLKKRRKRRIESKSIQTSKVDRLIYIHKFNHWTVWTK